MAVAGEVVPLRLWVSDGSRVRARVWTEPLVGVSRSADRGSAPVPSRLTVGAFAVPLTAEMLAVVLAVTPAPP